MRVGKAVFARALQNELSGLIEVSSRGDAVQSSEIAKVLVGRRAVRLVTEGNPLARRKEWLLGEGCACLKNDQEDSDAKGIHASERIALEVSRDAMKALDAYTAEVEEKTLWE